MASAAPSGLLTPSGVNTNVQTGSAGNGTIARTTTVPMPGTYNPATGTGTPTAPNNPGYSGPVGPPDPIGVQNAQDKEALVNGAPQVGPNSFTDATPSSPTVTTSDAAQGAVDGIGSSITSAANSPITAPTPQNPSGNPATQPPQSYVQYDGTYGPNPDPYGYGTPGYNPSNDPRVAADTNTANAPYIAQENTLAQENQQEISGLTGQEAQDEATQTGTDAATASNATLQILGASSGAPGSAGIQYMQSLANAHTASMQTLQAKYQTEIQAAQDAYNSSDFAVAQAMTKNAADTKAAATLANTNYLDYVQKQAAQDETDAYHASTEAQATATLQNSIATSARTFAAANNITQPFYELGGVLFSTFGPNAGQPITDPSAFAAAGGKPDMSNVYVVPPGDKSYAGGDLGEFQYLVDQGVYKPGDLQGFMNQKQQDAVQIAAAGRAPTQAQQDATDWSTFATGPNTIGALLQLKPGSFITNSDGTQTNLVGLKDGYLNPSVVKGLRDQVGLANPRLLPKFDSLVKGHLNPTDINTVGIGTYSPFYSLNQ
jgi:hypothetical protein